MQKVIHSLPYLLVAACLAGCSGQKQVSVPALPDDLPFDMPTIQAPNIPDRTFNLTDFGAVGDGHTLNTDAFARAVKTCSDAGGGCIVVPAGIWLTGPIELKSNLQLHLQQGSVVLFSPNIEHYPLKKGTYEGQDAVRRMSPLTGIHCENIAITGDGIIDGSGQAWRPVKKSKLTESQWKELTRSGGVVDADGRIWYPSENALQGPETVSRLDQQNADLHEYAAAAEHLRPVMVSLVNCKKVLLDGPTFQNSPAWNIHPLLCENMLIRNITVRNPWFSQNGDGLDLESCRNVLVENCRFDVGDDAICMKSGRDEAGRRRGRPTENIVIRDCTVYHGHGGFVVGSEMSGGVRNIFVSNCSFLGTDVGLRFKSTRGRGGIVENIYMENIRMTDIATDAIRFNLFYALKTPGPEAALEIPAEPVSEETPRFQNMVFKNIICRGAENALYMQGLPEMPVRDIRFENMMLSADAGVTCIETENIEFHNVSIRPKKGHSFRLYNSRRLTIDNPTFDSSSDDAFMKVMGDKSRAIRVSRADTVPASARVEFGSKVDVQAVSWE